MFHMGFLKLELDNSLFIRHKSAIMIYILVYVDDIIVIGINVKAIDWVISSLAAQFSIKDLGNLHYFLGIEVYQNSSGIVLS